MKPVEERSTLTITPIRTSKGVGIAIFDGARLILSLILFVLSVSTCLYAMYSCTTLMPSSFPNWLLFILFFVSIILLSITEGMHVACVQVAYRHFPKNFWVLYPNAMEILDYQNQGNNLQHFLVGRQIVVVCCVFILGRLTTFDNFWGISNVPTWIISTFTYSGFLGILLTVEIGQITPQIISSKYPLNYLNIWFIKYVFYFCIFLEQTGIAYVVWLFGWLFFKSTKEKSNSIRDKMNQDYFMKEAMLQHLNAISREYDETQDNSNKELEPLNQIKNDTKSLIKQKDTTIEQLAQQFEDAGLEIPCFLKPKNDPQYIAPHLIAMRLLESQCKIDQFESTIL